MPLGPFKIKRLIEASLAAIGGKRPALLASCEGQERRHA